MAGKLEDDQTPKTATINIQKRTENSLDRGPKKICQEGPRTQIMTKQPWKVTGPAGKEGSHNQYPKMARSLESEVTQKTPQRTPKPRTMTKQVSRAPDCLVSHLQKVPGPTDQIKGHNTPNGPHGGRIHISEITYRECRKAYRN